MSKRSTINTIARAAGVSVATVSRVINNPSLVAADKRWKVMEVMQRHNFWVTRRKRSGVGKPSSASPPKATARVGFLVPETSFRPVEVITEEMLRGVQGVFSRRGVELVLDYFPLEVKESDPLPKILQDRSVDGFLMRPPSSPVTLEAMARNRKVVVLNNSYAHLDIPCVMVDNQAGMRMAMDHLIGLGHQRIAFVGGPMSSLFHHERYRAYCLALLEKGLPVDERLAKRDLVWSLSAEDAFKICQRFWDELFGLSEPPTAIATSMDGLAAQLLRVAAEKNMAVPERVSITGFGDMEYSAFTDPPLTTVRIDHRAVGELGAQALLGLLEGMTPPSKLLVRPSWVERRSTHKID